MVNLYEWNKISIYTQENYATQEISDIFHVMAVASSKWQEEKE